MTNAQLDQRVAALLGWIWDGKDGCVWRDTDGYWVEKFDWSPSTNLAQAMGLWDERLPCNAPFEIQFAKSRNWIVWGSDDVGKVVPYADLPRAITEAWVQAKEAV